MDKIKQTIRDIIQDASGIVYNDDGNGCGGPGYADPETLQEMLNSGDFDDAVVVPFDEALARDSFSSVACGYDDQTDWTQIEFSHHDDGYHQIAWIWQP